MTSFLATVVNIYRGVFIRVHDAFALLIAMVSDIVLGSALRQGISDATDKSIACISDTNMANVATASIQRLHEAQIANQYESTILNEKTLQIVSQKVLDITNEYPVLVTNMKALQLAQTFAKNIVDLLEREIAVVIGDITVIAEWITYPIINMLISILNWLGRDVSGYSETNEPNPNVTIVVREI